MSDRIIKQSLRFVGLMGLNQGMSEDDLKPKEMSGVAKEIQRLKTATIRAAQNRERLPQPLFWSLFHSSLKEVREAKEQERLISDLLDT